MFSHVLDIDRTRRVLDVEGSASYETIINQTLPHGLIPTVTPELKGITVGGAIAGIGIESSGFRYGFVHDGLLEAEVLLPGGDVVTCNADNDHRDLFFGLPNSYGTLGYVLRARIALMPAKPYVRLTSIRCASVSEFLNTMLVASDDGATDFVDGLLYSPSELYVMQGRFISVAPDVADIYGETPYYRLIRSTRELLVGTEDYLFRYDPDWFWNVPEGGVYTLFRKVAPRWLRHSGFYSRYRDFMAALRRRLWRGGRWSLSEEQLIQDWAVPWNRAEELTSFSLEHADLDGKPWAAVPVRPARYATLYPLEPDSLYYNLGCYCWTKKPDGEPFHYTKLLERKCFELEGVKMLYSSSFLEENEFKRLYNGDAYDRLKQKYDPEGRAPTLYQKVTGRA